MKRRLAWWISLAFNGLVACGGELAWPEVGNLEVTAATSGTNLDPNGYEIRVDSTSVRRVGANAVVTLTGVGVGTHSVSLQGIAPNCWTPAVVVPRVIIEASGTAAVQFALTCTTPNTALITVTTQGGNPPASRGAILYSGGKCVVDFCFPPPIRQTLTLPANGTIQVMPEGGSPVSLTLTVPMPSCAVRDGASRRAGIPQGGIARFSFVVLCS